MGKTIDKLDRHFFPADPEIFQASLGLRSPERFLGHLEFAHAVFLDTEGLIVHRRRFSRFQVVIGRQAAGAKPWNAPGNVYDSRFARKSTPVSPV